MVGSAVPRQELEGADSQPEATTLILCRQPGIDNDMATLKADVFTDGEILENSCHHFT
jgi:hypothetical protein